MLMFYQVVINFLFGLSSFALLLRMIPGAKYLFLKAGLKGKDMSKKEKIEIPESLGAVCGTVFLVCMFLFIPVPFVTKWLEKDESNDFPHNEFVEFMAALLSICCMILLGFADDVLDLQWRYKLILPTIASLPLLMVYFVNFGSTTVVVPSPMRFWLGLHLNLGVFYYIYMGMLAVFCTNAINILAGVNGLETGQSLVIGLSILLFNIMELSGDSWKRHLFSLYFILPYCFVSTALLFYNWYPSEVFVGDTFCYFSGMTFAVVAILGHFSKTMLLFFLPQIFNFLYSIPQLFRFIPCPRHRLPKYNVKLDKLEMSKSTFKSSELKFFGKALLHIFKFLHIVDIEINLNKDENEEYIQVNNMTLINFIIMVLGPLHEESLVKILLLIQMLGTCLAFVIRYQVSKLFY
ncbi:UDP-N-acetylglucosamine--dolichyl-phosphate N-acetylglucosaminephosphotransferase isoform X3 [Hydra vulgaris]|uniref:UDP-N-acetylglucosamine--dolichyl-phosphate N-acetylglucosaminephosphotransferase n=2 Tax=Hydra vulgaris TaxID=6087 RepID=A0ABM4B774_HYDVU